MQSATKYLNGHSDVTAGMIAGARTRVDPIDLMRRTLGTVLDPQAAYAMARGLKTLPVRIERHNRNAAAVARFLEAHPRVARVFYPGLPSHPDHEVAMRQMSGFGGMVTFDVDGGLRGRGAPTRGGHARHGAAVDRTGRSGGSDRGSGVGRSSFRRTKPAADLRRFSQIRTAGLRRAAGRAGRAGQRGRQANEDSIRAREPSFVCRPRCPWPSPRDGSRSPRRPRTRGSCGARRRRARPPV